MSSGPRRRWFPLGGSPGLAAARTLPIDPLAGPAVALAGRIVTMNAGFEVIDDGVLYVERGEIVAVQPRRLPPPASHAGVRPVATGGTIYPGLIELHNHLSYNALPLWSPVPRRYEHRGQWPLHPDYRRLVSGPMKVIGAHRDTAGQAALIPPLVRYVECKCLMGGVTTSQGIMLASNAGVRRYYRGIVRNVEQTDDEDLPEAQARIPDIVAKDARRFLAQLKKEKSCFLLHLAEGITPDGSDSSVARRHFLALQVAPDEWALSPCFTGIHAAGLLAEDFAVLGRHEGAMVWSPLSNLLLYGETARVLAARDAGVKIGLGSDWSPSGSKNLLGELKVAWLVSQSMLGGAFSARDLVAMATVDAAAILKWQHLLGSLQVGRRADLIVVDGRDGDPYEALIGARETDLRLVMINGVARYGLPSLVRRLGGEGEAVTVGGKSRRLFLEQASGDDKVAVVSLAEARRRLRDALHDLPALAAALEARPAAATTALDAEAPLTWTLALDEIEETGEDLRPRLPFAGPGDYTGVRTVAPAALAAVPLAALLQPMQLDPLTVADDPAWLAAIAAQPNVPDVVRLRLADLY